MLGRVGQTRSAAVLLAAVTAACADRASLEIEVVPGDSLVAVFLDGAGAAVRAERLRVGSTATEVEAEPAHAVVVFSLPRDGFVDRAGRRLEDSVWDQLEVTLESGRPTLGRCGRCALPSGEAPSTVWPGDRCTLPAWLSAALDPASGEAPSAAEREVLIERARAQVELAWPGECECEARVDPPRRQLEVCPIGEPSAQLAPRYVAISDRGTVFGATTGFVSRAAVGGPVQVAPVEPALLDLALITPTPDDGVLLVTSAQSLFSATPPELRYFDARMVSRPVLGAPPLRPYQLQFRADGRLLVAGRRARSVSVHECQLSHAPDSVSASCQEYALDDGLSCPLINLQASAVQVYEHQPGQDLLVTSLGVVALRTAGSPVFRCLAQPGRDGVRWTLSSTVSVEEPDLLLIHRLTNDLFLGLVHAGGDVPEGAPQKVVVAGEVLTGAGGLPSEVRYRVLEVLPGPRDYDVSFVPVPGDSTRVAVLAESAALRSVSVYDGAARLLGRETGAEALDLLATYLPGLPRPARQGRVSPGGAWWALRDAEGELYRVSASSTTSWEPLSARPALLDAPVGVVAALDEESVLAVSERGVLRVRPGAGCGADQLEASSVEGRLPLDPQALVRAPSAGARYWVVGRRQLGRLDLDRGHAELSAAPPHTRDWIRAAALSSERLLLLDDGGRLFTLDGDDQLLRVAPPSAEVSYLSLAGHDGVAWAGGFDRLDRLREVGETELRVEPALSAADREDWLQVDADRRRAPFVNGLGAECGARGLVYTHEDLNVGAGLSVSDSLRIFDLASGRGRIQLTHARSFESFSEALPTAHGAFPLVTWLPDGPVTAFPHREGASLYALGTEPRALPFGAASSSARAGEWMVIAAGTELRFGEDEVTPERSRARLGSTSGFRLAKVRLVAARAR